MQTQATTRMRYFYSLNVIISHPTVFEAQIAIESDAPLNSTCTHTRSRKNWVISVHLLSLAEFPFPSTYVFLTVTHAQGFFSSIGTRDERKGD
jgi:hypothetical protein